MPRNISFALTTEQFRSRTKTVTRRLGWKTLAVGQVLVACVKCMGLKPGEKIQRLGRIRVTSVTRERLSAMTEDAAYGKQEAEREGFPGMSGEEFVEMFCRHMKPKQGIAAEVTRIEFEYLD
jgi:hypothetical protein